MLVFPGNSYALRCGTLLENVGDLKHKVLLACGESEYKEILGYIDRGNDGVRISVLKIEEWILNISGEYYSLIFEGNRLTSIGPAGSEK